MAGAITTWLGDGVNDWWRDQETDWPPDWLTNQRRDAHGDWLGWAVDYGSTNDFMSDGQVALPSGRLCNWLTKGHEVGFVQGRWSGG